MSKILRFNLAVPTEEQPQEVGMVKDIWSRFFPNGRYVLNRTEWKGKEPRSCAVTRVSSKSKQMGDGKPMIVEIEVTYRAKGEINFVGKTRYDGWQAMVPARTESGEFADGDGNPLPDGASLFFQPKDVYEDVEYNDLDFGDLVQETEEGGIQQTTKEAVFEELQASGRIGGVAFIAARRSRPWRKLLVVNAEANAGVDGFGTVVEVIPASTPQLKTVLSQKLAVIMGDFIEGRCTIKNIGNEQMTLAMLSDVLVDCTNPNGKSRFGVLSEFTEPNFMEDLAKHLMSAYELDVSIVPGEEGGLVLRHSTEKR